MEIFTFGLHFVRIILSKNHELHQRNRVSIENETGRMPESMGGSNASL